MAEWFEWTLLRGGELFAQLDAADGGRAQCDERHGGGGAGGGAGSSGGGDCGGAGDVQEREAAAGGEGGGGWRDGRSTTSRIIRRRSARRCGRCGQLMRGGGFGRCWSRGRIRCGAMCLRRRWWRAWRWRIAWCWLRCSSRDSIPVRSGWSRRRLRPSCARLELRRGRWPMRRRLWLRLRRSWKRAMLWRSCRMAGSGISTTCCRRRSRL